MTASNQYSCLALLIIGYFLLLFSLGGWLVPGHERWVLVIGCVLLFLSIVAVSALISAKIRRAVLDKAQRWRFYPSLLVIVLYMAWGLSLFILPIDE